jgi:hypothetical protein
MSRSRFSLSAVRRPGPLVALSLAYLLLVSGVMIWRGISVSPDYLLLILVPVALLSGRFVRFLRDWVPFIALFLGYEALRGISRKSGLPVHYGDVIRADRAMFGGVDPTQWLQAHLGSPHWLADRREDAHHRADASERCCHSVRSSACLPSVSAIGPLPPA